MFIHQRVSVAAAALTILAAAASPAAALLVSLDTVDGCFLSQQSITVSHLSATGSCHAGGSATGTAFTDLGTGTLGAFAESTTGSAEVEARFSNNIHFAPNQSVPPASMGRPASRLRPMVRQDRARSSTRSFPRPPRPWRAGKSTSRSPSPPPSMSAPMAWIHSLVASSRRRPRSTEPAPPSIFSIPPPSRSPFRPARSSLRTAFSKRRRVSPLRPRSPRRG